MSGAPKKATFIDEMRNFRQDRKSGPKKFTYEKSVAQEHAGDPVPTQFNRKGLKAPAPDKLPKTLTGKTDIEALRAEQVKTLNKKPKERN